ncbi:micronuclear linker histone polyprotein-like [Chenopodium quinoa]|uniref:micronuclear linker histone polyprotein-like n=1 Tax=Chenopodium quinoa TaxID=63459 RepID=UPI000B7930FC|nr:micronuclear linker histone polyprotein-like [Chenopodium quinoa]
MATAAFRSTTRRTSIGGDSNSNSSTSRNSTSSSSHHRRSRSVSRFSHRLPAEVSPEEPPSASRRGKFVNTVRGSGVPEISLDDLAIEMFSLSDIGERGRTTSDEVSSANRDDKTASHRRGRSVSRRGARVGELRSKNFGEKKGDFDGGTSRRRRSLSVARNYQISDSENEHIQKNRSLVRAKDLNTWSKQKAAMQPTSSNQRRGLWRSSSQKDLLRSYDGYSSYSSTLTDDEGNDACYNANRRTKDMQTASKQNKEPQASGYGQWSKALQKDYTNPAKDIRLDYRQVKAENQLSELASNNGLQSSDSDALKAVSTVRRNYKSKLEESEKRKQELLAEIMLEEERGKELKKIVGELLPHPKSTPVKRAARGRKRSTDTIRMPKQLVEEADKIIDEFISSVEETDISSFDGERSDTSSVFGGAVKPTWQYGDTESFKSPMRSDLLPGEMDGVVLPWLKWETGDDGTPLLGSYDKQHPTTPTTVLQGSQEMTAGDEQEQSSSSKSSRGSWSPGVANSFSLDVGNSSKSGVVESYKSQLLSRVPRKSQVDIDDYLKLTSNEGFLSERWIQRERIHSGGLLICNSRSSGKFLY